MFVDPSDQLVKTYPESAVAVIVTDSPELYVPPEELTEPPVPAETLKE